MREISFAYNSCSSWPIALTFCTKHGSITAVLSAKFQTDWTIETDAMDEPDFARFEFKMNFGRISYKAGDILGWPYNEYHRNSLTYGGVTFSE